MTRALLGSGAASDALHAGAQYRVRVRAEAAEETSAWSEVPSPPSTPAPHVLVLSVLRSFVRVTSTSTCTCTLASLQRLRFRPAVYVLFTLFKCCTRTFACLHLSY